ncbi:DUF5998 family protein [Sinomonas halotolerans]|uniref:DUF5998 family protein n=1 Tax=Sinomonas halotolerans TaxID=1644133 RepID=A0ABU9X322_9MICC
MSHHAPEDNAGLPNRGPSGETLTEALQRTGFYPRLVGDVVADALDGRAPLSHLTHLETHFERSEVRRHVTVLVLTQDMLVVTHVDEAPLDDEGHRMSAQVSTESVPVSQIATVVLSYVYAQPVDYTPGDPVREVTLSIAWSGGQRIDLMPAGCGDPQCDADHGYTGTVAREDLVLRISAEADGPRAVQDAKHFARLLRAVNTGSAPSQAAPRPRLSFAPRAQRTHGGRA